jgi:hypothetical protein
MVRWIALFLGLVAAASLVILRPLLRRRPCCSNASGAIATLRTLGSAQEQCRRAARIDVDRDQVGEYGTFGELSGAVGVRLDPAGETRGPAIEPTLLPLTFTLIDSDGVVSRGGYLFRVFLPARANGAAREGATREGLVEERDNRLRRDGPNRWPGPVPESGSPMVGRIDTDLAESRWCAYAWPVTVKSGTEAFFVDPSGSVWETANGDGRYAGSSGSPAWDAAMPATGRAGSGWSSGGLEFRGRDGNLWRRRN